MRSYKNVDDLRRDFSDLNTRLSNASGDRISDPKLASDLRDFGQGIDRFVSGSNDLNTSNADRTTQRSG